MYINTNSFMMIGNAFNRGKGLHAGTSPSVIQTDTVVHNQTNWPGNNYWKQSTPVIANRNWMKELALDVMPNGEVGEHFNEICEQQEKDTYVCGPAKEIQPIQTFEDMLDQQLANNCYQNMHFKQLVPLQKWTIPVLLKGHNLLVRAPTGSGKTAAFLLPAIQFVIDYHKNVNIRNQMPLVLILGNTQNLMKQTFSHACNMAGYDLHNRMFNTGVTVCSLYQGGNINGRRNITQDIVIAVPQSVLNKLDEEIIDLSKLHLLIIDEADKMVDDMRGFGREIISIYDKIPEHTREKLIVAMFSATYVEEANELTLNNVQKKLFRSLIPSFIDVPISVGYITQRVMKKDIGIFTPFMGGLNILLGLIEADCRLYKKENEGFYKKSSVIFVEKKITCNYLACYLQQKGYDFLPLNGDYYPEYVSSTLSFLKSGSIQGVVATNKLARGQDIPDVDHVIVFEMAEDFNDYCHRIGRTGRIGRGGRATVLLSLTNNTDIKHIPALVKFMKMHKQKIPKWLWALYSEQNESNSYRILPGLEIYDYPENARWSEREGADSEGDDDRSDYEDIPVNMD